MYKMVKVWGPGYVEIPNTPVSLEHGIMKIKWHTLWFTTMTDLLKFNQKPAFHSRTGTES